LETRRLAMDRLKTRLLRPTTAERMHKTRNRPFITIAKLVVINGEKDGDILFMKSGNLPG
jgi:hypothetical protein